MIRGIGRWIAGVLRAAAARLASGARPNWRCARVGAAGTLPAGPVVAVAVIRGGGELPPDIDPRQRAVYESARERFVSGRMFLRPEFMALHHAAAGGGVICARVSESGVTPGEHLLAVFVPSPSARAGGAQCPPSPAT